MVAPNDQAVAPWVSVVIPAYNRTAAVGDALRSLLRQDFTDWEAIVVDDGSADGEALEAAVLRFEDARIRYARRPNGGGGAARNSGIDLARGDYVALLDSDDQFLPHKLSTARAVLAPLAGERVLFFSQMLVERGVGRQWVKPARGPHPGERVDDYLTCTSGWIQTSTMVLSAALAREVRFDERLPSSQDTDFAIRCASAGARVLFHAAPLTIMSDAYDPARVSKQRRHQPLLLWTDRMRGRHVSERSYFGYRGWQCARIASSSDLLLAARLFLPAVLRGCYAPRTALTIAAQIFLPQRGYQRIATAIVRLLGSRTRPALGTQPDTAS